MSAQNLDEGEEKKPSKGAAHRKRKLSDPERSVPAKQGALFVDKYRSELIQKVHMVMPVLEELLSQGLLDEETRRKISTLQCDEDKMIELYKSLDAGGNKVKSAFYSELKDYEANLVEDLEDADFSKEFEEDADFSKEFEGSQFVDKYRSELIQKVRMVMPVLEELLSQGLLDEETRKKISTLQSDEDKMTELYEALDAGGDKVKSAFYSELKDYEPHLVQDLVYPDLSMEFEDDMICQYKISVIDRCKFVTEYNPPSDEPVELTARYTEPVIIQRSKDQTEKYCHEHVRSAHTSETKTSPQLLSNDKNHSIRIDQLFSPDSDGNTPKTVILSGDSGRGKSFTLQKIMLDWASGELYSENFDVVFLLNCEELKCISEEMSLNELLSWGCSLKSDEILQILQLTPKKVLFLIDGLDNYVCPAIKPAKTALGNLLRGVLLPESFMLVTTRSIADDAVMNLLKGPQRFTEIVGFSETGVQEYFHKFFQDEQLFKKTYECLKTSESLLTTCSVPLMCWMVCFCLKKYSTGSQAMVKKLKTTTSIYVHFVSALLEHHGESQSVLTMLRSLGQLAEEGVKKRKGLFVEKSVTATGLDHATNVFLIKGSLKDKQKPVFRFMHPKFQEFFTALYYVLLEEEQSFCKVSELLSLITSENTISRPSPERSSNPMPSVMMFLCGLLNEKVRRSFFKKIEWTIPHTKKLKKTLQNSVLIMRRQHGCQLLALHCLYELHDEVFMRRALADWESIDLSNISLRSTDCWALLYCLQCCPHIRELNLMYCDLTADKLKILQPALCMCETLRLSVDHLSEVGDSIKMFAESNILRKLDVQEDKYSTESPRWSLNLAVSYEDFLLSLRNLEKNSSFLKISLTCAHSKISNFDWRIFLQRAEKAGRFSKDASNCDENVSLLLSSFHSVGIKKLDLKVFSLNESWASGIISLVQTCTSLQQLSVSVTGLLLEVGLELLYKSLTDPHCTVTIKGRKCSKSTDQCKEEDWSHRCNEKRTFNFKPKVLEESTISEPEPSGLDLHPLPVCQSCVHTVDSDQWVQVEPSVCTDEGGSKFRISTQAGRFECNRTRMRWVCAGDVTLQYHAVDGCFLSAELERLQCERIGPVIDVTVISGKLEEAHLPHYVCLGESDPSLKDAVKLLSVEKEGIFLKSVELTRYHAKISQPSFSPSTVVKEKDVPVEEHFDVLIFMENADPILLIVYLFPLFDTLSKQEIMQRENGMENPNIMITQPRPVVKIQMETPHILDVPGGDVIPMEGISFLCKIEPNFFNIRKCFVSDLDMSLIRKQDQTCVWQTKIFKEKFQIVKKDFKYKQDICFFDKHWVGIINGVTDVDSIADQLLHQQVITNPQYSKIRTRLESQEKMREICSIVRNVPTKKAMLISILQQLDPFLFKDLETHSSP